MSDDRKPFEMSDRSRLREMLDDVRAWRRDGWRMSKNGMDITDQWIADQLSRARRLWRAIIAQ